MGLSRSTKPVASSELRTRVRRFYAYQTASSFAIWIPFWALWIRGHLSSDFDFTLVDVAFWIGLLVFQLPVGVVADRTPRRRTIVLSELFRSAGILGYGLSATFWGYVAANVVWSLGAAFSIGPSAYLYEVLLEAGHETEFPRYIGRVTMIQLLSNAAGAFVGGVFVGVVGDLRLTLLVGAILNLGAVGVAVTFREPKVERTPESTYVEQLVQGLRVVRRREGVALLIGVEVFLGVTLYVMAVFRPLYLQALGLSESAIAISISGFLLVAAIWSAFAGTITRVLGEFGTLALLVLMASAAFFGMYGAGQFPGAALLQVPLYIVWSLQPALTTAFLNRRLEPGPRATVLSMGAFAYTLGRAAPPRSRPAGGGAPLGAGSGAEPPPPLTRTSAMPFSASRDDRCSATKVRRLSATASGLAPGASAMPIVLESWAWNATIPANIPCPCSDRSSSTTSSAVQPQRSNATGHRGWNRQPAGMFTGSGRSPFRITRSTFFRGSGLGTTEMSACVYGCFGCPMTCSAVPISTIFPRYITAIRSARTHASPRSCVMNRYVSPFFSRSSRRSWRMSVRIDTSSIDTGSSATTNSGSRSIGGPG